MIGAVTYPRCPRCGKAITDSDDPVFVATRTADAAGNVPGVQIHPECAAGRIAAAGAFGLGLVLGAGVMIVLVILLLWAVPR